MNLRIKAIWTVCLLLAVFALVTGCSSEGTPYETNDADQYTVSVRYDANGGTFTTNTSVIVDSYKLSELPADGGQAQVALLTPDDPRRGNDAFTATKNGYFLAGWYAQRTETGDGEYTYFDPWDFETDRLSVDTDGEYSSAEPVLTLYAAWVPMFEIEFYSLDSGEYLETLTFNPNVTDELLVPAWDEETGTIEMYDFPELSGHTFNGAYYDAEGKQAVDTVVEHPGTVDPATGVAENHTMKLYVDWMEGEWYHIYNVEQFLENASVNGSYILYSDLDFEGQIWPTSLMYGNFAGSIEGNGHTIRNVEVTQTNNSKVNAGLFGQLMETAVLRDLTLENVTFTIQAGTRVSGASYGLLAGTVSGDALLENVTVTDSTLLIDSGCYFGTDDYTIGLVCGLGEPDVDASGITCQATGDDPDSVEITVTGSEVIVEFVTE